MCPSNLGLGSVSHKNSVSLVPRLIITSPGCSLIPATEAEIIQTTLSQAGFQKSGHIIISSYSDIQDQGHKKFKVLINVVFH